jgi:hypothetical protein
VRTPILLFLLVVVIVVPLLFLLFLLLLLRLTFALCRGLSDPDAFAERERQRDAEEEEEARRRQEEEAAAALRRSDSDSDELEGDVSSWVYLNKKVPGQDLVVHHAGTQTDISAFATSSADNTTVDEANEEEGQEDRFLDVEAEQLGAADVAELLQRYKLLVVRLRQA